MFVSRVFSFFLKLSESFVRRNGLQQECSRSCNDGCSRRTDHAVSHGNGGRGAESCSEHRKRARQQFSGIGSGGIGGQCYGFRCRIRLVVKRSFVCVCVEVADGRTDGRCGPRKGGAAVGKRICGLGISIFFCCYFTYWRQQGRRTTESYYRFWACSARPPLTDVECQVWW